MNYPLIVRYAPLKILLHTNPQLCACYCGALLHRKLSL
jgi:hypothetical protein